MTTSDSRNNRALQSRTIFNFCSEMWDCLRYWETTLQSGLNTLWSNKAYTVIVLRRRVDCFQVRYWAPQRRPDVAALAGIETRVFHPNPHVLQWWWRKRHARVLAGSQVRNCQREHTFLNCQYNINFPATINMLCSKCSNVSGDSYGVRI